MVCEWMEEVCFVDCLIGIVGVDCDNLVSGLMGLFSFSVGMD